MRTIERKITREEYERLSGLDYKTMDNEITSGLDMSILCGYGYYGHRAPYTNNGEFFYSYEIGSSCD